MRQVLPVSKSAVDLFDAFAWEPPQQLPQVRVGMVMSVNGAASDEEGWTSRLGGPADRRVLQVLRTLSDGILVGAGSIRTGKYPPHRLRGDYLSYRLARGNAMPSPLIVVTRSLKLDWTLPSFTAVDTPTIVLTCRSAVDGATTEDGYIGDILVAGGDSVDLRLGLQQLRHRYGMRHILCEGGPGLAAALFNEGLVEELCLSLAPVLVPGEARGIVQNASRRHVLTMRALYEESGELFIRYGVGKYE